MDIVNRYSHKYRSEKNKSVKVIHDFTINNPVKVRTAFFIC